MRTNLYLTEFIPPDPPSPLTLLEPRLQDSYRPALMDATSSWNEANPFDEAECGQYQPDWSTNGTEGAVVVYVKGSDACHAWLASLLPNASYDLGALVESVVL